MPAWPLDRDFLNLLGDVFMMEMLQDDYRPERFFDLAGIKDKIPEENRPEF